MEPQTIIVMLIVLSALAYVGSKFRQKAKSFSAKNSCAVDCGCDSKGRNKTIKA